MSKSGFNTPKTTPTESAGKIPGLISQSKAHLQQADTKMDDTNESLLSLLSNLSHESESLRKQVAEWLSPEASQTLINIVTTKVQLEEKEYLATFAKVDFGVSYAGLNTLRQSILKEVRSFSQTHHKRPKVADLGAGLGNMTWKLLAAGADVDVFEHQPELTNEIKRRLKETDPLIWQDAKLKDIVKFSSQNMFQTLRKNEFKEKYDFLWIGNVIHFLFPHEIKVFIAILKRVLKPGGKFFLESDISSTLNMQTVKNYYLIEHAIERAKKAGCDFPGFLASNHAVLFNKNENKIITRSIITAWHEKEIQALGLHPKMTSNGIGYLLPNKFDKHSIELDQQVNNTLKKMGKESIVLARGHTVMNRMDLESAKKFFKNRAGFISIKIENSVDEISLYMVMQKPNLNLSLNSTSDTSPVSERLPKTPIGIDFSKSMNFFAAPAQAMLKTEASDLTVTDGIIFDIKHHCKK